MKKTKHDGNHPFKEHRGEIHRKAAERAAAESIWRIVGDARPPDRAPKHYKYVDELVRLQFELLKLQESVRRAPRCDRHVD